MSTAFSKPDSDFDRKKAQILYDLAHPEATDLSPKGSVDIPMLPIMEVINNHQDYVTTSSCSGRIAVYCDPVATTEASELTTKGGGHWFYVSHDPVPDTLLESATFDPVKLLLPNVKILSKREVNEKVPTEGWRIVWLKFEPMVLHVQARDIQLGKALHELSYSQGFRNSGIVLSNKGRSMVGIRSAPQIAVPIAHLITSSPEPSVDLLVDPEYLTTLIRLSNQKFSINFQHMDRYRLALIESFANPKQAASIEENRESKEDRRERKRRMGLLRQQQLLEEEKKKDSLTDISPLDEISESD